MGGSAVAPKRVKLEYDASDRLTKDSRYKDLAATQLVFDTAHEYFPVGWHQSQSSQDSGSTEIAGYNWTYDLSGRMDTFTVNNSSYSTAENVTDYTYDNLDQLTAADRASTANDESYGYNAAGNRNAGGFTATTNNRYSAVSIGGVTYTPGYDNEGNLTSLTRTGTNQDIVLTYDHRNRLVSYATRTAGVETKHVDYWYDVFDRRVKMAVDPDGNGGLGWTTTFWWHDGQNPLLEIDAGTNSITHRYLYGNAVDQVLADERYAPGGGNQPTLPGALRLPIADHLNTTRDIVDSTGTVINHLAYDSFGQVKSETNGAIDYLFGFGGFERDEATGLLHSDTRYYHPGLGRWTSEDPIGFAGGDANLVRYVGNGPTNSIDSSGLSDDWKYVWHWHHTLPQEIFSPKFLEQRGLDININARHFGWMMRGVDHIGEGGVHSLGWNSDWLAWITKMDNAGTKITSELVEAQRVRMMGIYGMAEIGHEAKLSYDDIKAARRAAKRIAEQKAAQEAAELAAKGLKKAIASNADEVGEGLLKKGGRALGRIPVVGLVFSCLVGSALGDDDPFINALEPMGMGATEFGRQTITDADWDRWAYQDWVEEQAELNRLEANRRAKQE